MLELQVRALALYTAARRALADRVDWRDERGEVTSTTILIAVFAALAFFLDAIPNIGATLANVIPATVALATRGLTTALIVVAAVLVYQQLENNIIQPRVLSKRLNVPPVLTLIAILVGGKLLGVLGVILAIPLAGTLPVLERIWITQEEGETNATRPERPPGSAANAARIAGWSSSRSESPGRSTTKVWSSIRTVSRTTGPSASGGVTGSWRRKTCSSVLMVIR